MTVKRRMADIAANLTNQLKQKVKEFCFYLLAMNISEELAAMQLMKGRTTGKNICTELINCVNKKLAYSFTNLVAICTDRAPAMRGKHTGAVSLIQEVIERRIITHHCIIHQQALCGKILKFDHVMSVVVSVLNYLRACTLKHKTFRAFLKKVDAEYKDLHVVYHAEVR